MKYIRLFADSFMESFSRETAVQVSMALVWIWRGAYFCLGVLVILWLTGWLKW